jgi:hypothetical protein
MYPARFAPLALCLITSSVAAAGGASATGPAAPAAAPTFKNDSAQLLDFVQKHVIDLEQAFPQSKMAWRPAKGVRTVGEAFLHMAGGNYFILGKLGFPPPASLKPMLEGDKWDKQTSDKDAIKKILTDSFAYVRTSITSIPDADLDKTVDMMGHPVSKRGMVMICLGHIQEHLGQTIAYARSNGVVPPWSKAGE